jgi:hypothetical protein
LRAVLAGGHVTPAERPFRSRVPLVRGRGRALSELVREGRRWPAYDQIAVDATSLADVRRLVRRHGVHGFDAIHLAAAVWLQSELGAPVEFCVADERLEAAVRREKMRVINPERPA